MAVVLPVLIQRQSGSPQDLRTRRQDSHFALQPRVMRALRAKLMPRPANLQGQENSRDLRLEKAKRRQAQVKLMDSQVKLRALLWPVKQPGIRPPEREMQRENSLALEKARPQARAKLLVPIWPVELPERENPPGLRSEKTERQAQEKQMDLRVTPRALLWPVNQPAMRPEQESLRDSRSGKARAVTQPAIRQEMQRENSLALEKARPQAQTKTPKAQVELPARESLRDSRSEQAERFPVPQVRPCPYWKGPDPFASFQSAPADQKCNRAGRCDARPILGAASAQDHAFDQCPTRRNQDAIAGYDNRSNHWRQKHGYRAQSFPISAPDKHRCLPRPFADRDVRFADSESRSIPPRRR